MRLQFPELLQIRTMANKEPYQWIKKYNYLKECLKIYIVFKLTANFIYLCKFAHWELYSTVHIISFGDSADLNSMLYLE